MLPEQTAVDITVGITDEQASEMARNLEFKGPALQEVYLQTIYSLLQVIFPS